MTSIVRPLAAPAAILAIIGTVGWVGGPALARGVLTPASAVMAGLLALVIGGTVYAMMQRAIAGALRPIGELSEALRDAAKRPRDHIRAFRRLRVGSELERATDAHELGRALEFFLRRVEERQLRQAAWAGALVHDVKTPVAAAATALAAVSSDVQTWTGAERELVQRVSTELRGLASHVQELLEAIRLDREDVELDLTDIDLADAVRRVLVTTTWPNGIEVDVTGAGHARADPMLIDRALENLFSNAFRYARSRVRISVFEGLVSVSDDGPGLPAPLEVLTEPFRSETITLGTETLHGGAAGMGLFLVRRVLEIHDGKLVVERSDGTGTVLLAYIGRPQRRHA